MLTGPPFSSRPITFSETNVCIIHFSHNDALIITMHIGSYRVSRFLVDSRSCVNILYRSTLDRMEETLEIAQAMIHPQTQSNLYGLTKMRHDLTPCLCQSMQCHYGVRCDRHGIHSQHNFQATMDLYDESRPIQLPSGSMISHSNRETKPC